MKMKYEYPNKMKKKVVITGISLVTPLGLNKKDTWQNRQKSFPWPRGNLAIRQSSPASHFPTAAKAR